MDSKKERDSKERESKERSTDKTPKSKRRDETEKKDRETDRHREEKRVDKKEDEKHEKLDSVFTEFNKNIQEASRYSEGEEAVRAASFFARANGKKK